ncbi:MAG: ribonuclease III [Nitrospirae bacterium]|nr:ribonuclease III [Nitrospirota bacterium]
MPSLSDIQQRIGYTFKDAELLERALTHKSYANENRVPYHNERMEFLGDSVLSLVISEYLMKTCPDSTEGDLSRLRAAVVSEPALAAVSRGIALGDHLLLGKGEDQTGGRNKDSLLSDCLEALIAAVYLDSGKDAAESLVIRLFEEVITKSSTSGGSLDYKTELQELCQEQLKQLPEYRSVSETGPDHQKLFEMEVWVKGQLSGRGLGKSKKEAEQRAAKEALAMLSEKTNHC